MRRNWRAIFNPNVNHDGVPEGAGTACVGGTDGPVDGRMDGWLRDWAVPHAGALHPPTVKLRGKHALLFGVWSEPQPKPAVRGGGEWSPAPPTESLGVRE